jgi:hypothetical protein
VTDTKKRVAPPMCSAPPHPTPPHPTPGSLRVEKSVWCSRESKSGQVSSMTTLKNLLSPVLAKLHTREMTLGLETSAPASQLI